MSQAEELLNSLDVSNASEESHIVIGKDRFITVPDALKRLAVQYDHDIETVTFDCPRYWDEHDMSTMAIYVNYLCADKEPGCYKAKNVTVDSVDSTIMHFDWTISKNVTMAYGPIAFLVCVRNTDSDGIEKNHWNSEICEDCYISAGIEYDGGDINEIYPDIVEQWRREVLAITDDIVSARENGEFKGDPGVSPSIQIIDINGGHRVTITDADGTKSFNVMDTIIESSDAVNELLNRFIHIGTLDTMAGATLVFDTDVSSTNEGAYDHNYGCYIGCVKDGTYTALYPRTRKDLVFGMDEIDNFVTANKGIVAHSDDGITYTATVPGITELTVGASFVMIPDKDSKTEYPKLNVNNLGNRYITRKSNVSTGTTYDSDPNITGEEGRPFYWLSAETPIRITYHADDGWAADFALISGQEICGSVLIANGGTGANNIEQAAKNLKFNSLAYATDLSTIDNINAEIPIGKYYISANTYQGSGEFPFLKYWDYCILTVEDSNGKGGKASTEAGNSGNDSYYFQTIVSDRGEKFYREIVFNNGSYVDFVKWSQCHVSASPIILNTDSYGEAFPTIPTEKAAMNNGRLFFKKNDGVYIYLYTKGWVKYL